MDDLLDRLRALTKQQQYETAIGLCDEALASTGGDGRARLWRLRSYVHQQMQRYDMAVEDASAGLVDQPGDMSLLFERATSYVELRRYLDANADLERLLESERAQGGDFFEAAALMLQAICLNNLARPNDALAVSERLPRDARTWALGRLWTPDDLEAESRAQL